MSCLKTFKHPLVMTAKNKRQQKKRITRDVHGILLLDKPTGITSNKALQDIKYTLQAKKAGHTGSLDPLATGLLPLCFGEATKISQYLLESDKTYEVTAKLGVKTDSADSDGEVVKTQAVPKLSEEQVKTVIESFLGDSEQIPPMYSALKVDGQRLYKLARKGEVIERKPRKVTIGPIELLSLTEDSFSLRVTVSKGTYIRSLVEDIASKLNTIAHVTVLRRIGVSPFMQPKMINIEDFRALSQEEQEKLLLPIESALMNWKKVQLSNEHAQDLRHGKLVRTTETIANDMVLALDDNGQALALAEVDAHGVLKSKRLLLLPMKI